jgi:plasmid stability protein
MGTPAQVGKREFQEAIRQGREANAEVREALKRMMREGGPVVQALVARASLSVLDNENALARLDEIGRSRQVIVSSKW